MVHVNLCTSNPVNVLELFCLSFIKCFYAIQPLQGEPFCILNFESKIYRVNKNLYFIHYLYRIVRFGNQTQDGVTNGFIDHLMGFPLFMDAGNPPFMKILNPDNRVDPHVRTKKS